VKRRKVGKRKLPMSSRASPNRHVQPAPPSSVAVPRDHRLAFRIKRVGLISAMALASLNAWTGSPLAALWVGSRVQGDGPPAMEAVAVVALTMGAISYGLVKLLGWLGLAYDKLIGLPARRKQHSPWLRSLRGEREEFRDPDRHSLSAIEIVLISSVILAVVAFEVWFFFYSTSPIDQRTGR
jgi:hypothetical protein